MIFQDLDLGETLSAEAKLRATEGGGKDPLEAKSLGNRAQTKQTEQTEQTNVPPVTNRAPFTLARAPSTGA